MYIWGGKAHQELDSAASHRSLHEAMNLWVMKQCHEEYDCHEKNDLQMSIVSSHLIFSSW